MNAILVFLVAVTAQAAWVDDVRVRAGDDPRWAAPAFDDSSWERMKFWEVPGGDSIRWIRTHVDVEPDARRAGHPLAIYIGAQASHELWWDGVRIGRGGTVGRTCAQETPGPIEAHYQIPDSLAAPGRHTLAVRTSAFHRGFRPMVGYWSILVGDYDGIARFRTSYAWVALVSLSAMLLMGVFALVMAFVNRADRGFLLLAALCFTSAALLVAEEWRALFGYTYDWHIVRLLVVTSLSALLAILLVLLVVVRFPRRGGRWVVAMTILACALATLARGWDMKAGLMLGAGFILATLWSLRARAPLTTLGLGVPVILLALNPILFAERALYFSLDFLFLCLLCSHALDVRRERQAKSEALLKSARLELEVVKRHLQPHFVMNTLTALSEWIEQDPKTAVRMIDSLAEELRLLAAISDRKLIDLGDELRLCRSHLANMSLRKDARYELHTDGVDERALVPPAIFHTLVENAVTHGAAGVLRLSASRHDDRTRYVFEAPAGEESGGAPGTGTRYIEARLRESWGDAWTFAQRRAGDLWRAELEVPA